MCFDETTSWVTFGGGSVLNIISIIIICYWRLDIDILTLVFAWWYGLFMQIPEAMVWRENSSDTWGEVAFCLNVTQPVVWFILALSLRCLRPSTRLKDCMLVIASLSMITYIVTFSIHVGDCEFSMITNDCDQLVLQWWKNCLDISVLFYMTTMYFTIFTLSYPWNGLTTLLFTLTWVISQIIYTCSVGSVWCWLIACCGFVTTIVALLVKKKESTFFPT